MMYPIGETKVFAMRDELGDNSAEFLRPPVGIEWIIHYLYTWHTAAGGCDIKWYIKNPNYYMDSEIVRVTPAAALTKVFFNVESAIGLPWRFNHNIYPYAVRGALGAGEIWEIHGMVLERPADLELELREWYAAILRRPLPAGMINLRDRISKYRGGV
jgi:hypothetical protein